MMSDKEQRKAIGRMLYLISAAARVLCVASEKRTKWRCWLRFTGDMRELLREYESLIGAKDEQSCPESPSSPSTFPNVTVAWVLVSERAN